MKKIILVQPKNELNEATYVPLGLISLAAFIRKDFDVKIIDLRFESLDFLYDQIKELKPISVGFSMLTGSCIKQIIEASREIKKKYPNVQTVVGGIHPTFFPEQTLENSFIDFVIVREGEKTLLELLRAIENKLSFKKVSNLCWKDEKGQIRVNEYSENFLCLDDLPVPAWDLIDVERYVKKLSNAPDEWVVSGESMPRRVINMYTCKGCPFSCSFCYNLNFNKRKWRAKSPKLAVDEMEMLYRKYKINYFIIHDDNFVINRSRAIKIAELIRERGMKIQFSIDSRIDFFDYEFFKKMKKGGLCEVRVGCESGSNRILKDVIQKGITKEQTIKAIGVARDLNLKLLLSFVIGWPTETVSERQDTINLVLKLQKIYPKAAVYPLWIYLPYPGTTLFDLAVKMGFKQPVTLAGWGSYFWGKANIPWLENPREYELIHELSRFVWYNKTWDKLPKRSPRAVLKFAFIKFFRPLLLYRFENNFWKFPVDAEMLVGIKRYVKRKMA